MSAIECGKVVEILDDYLDGELAGDCCHDVEEHITVCPSCARFVASLRMSRGLCHQLRMTEMPGPMRSEAKAELLAAYRKALETRR